MPEIGEYVIKVRADIDEARAQIAELRSEMRVVPLGDVYVIAVAALLLGLLFGAMA